MQWDIIKMVIQYYDYTPNYHSPLRFVEYSKYIIYRLVMFDIA